MKVKLFYKTQREVATTFNYLVDAYWKDEIKEEELIENVKQLYINNKSKVLKGTDFTTVLRQQCGKRRLEIVDRILDMDNA